MIILLYVILGLLVVMLLAYLLKFFKGFKKDKVKVKKEKTKPEKNNEKLIIGNKEPEFRPIVKDADVEEEKGAEEPVLVDKLEEPQETEVESTIEKQDDKYIPSWDREEEEESDEDDLEEFLHFPQLSNMVVPGATLSEQIRNLPPETKALMMSNIFDKKI